jgi:hypothetical protein
MNTETIPVTPSTIPAAVTGPSAAGELAASKAAPRTLPGTPLLSQMHVYWLVLILANVACLGLMSLILFK